MFVYIFWKKWQLSVIFEKLTMFLYDFEKKISTVCLQYKKGGHGLHTLYCKSNFAVIEFL